MKILKLISGVACITLLSCCHAKYKFYRADEFELKYLSNSGTDIKPFELDNNIKKTLYAIIDDTDTIFECSNGFIIIASKSGIKRVDNFLKPIKRRR